MSVIGGLTRGLIKWREVQTRNMESVSLRAFADYLGFSHASILGWINGKQPPELNSLVRIAEKLEPLVGMDIYDDFGLDRPDRRLSELRASYDVMPEDKRQEFYEMIERWLIENGFWRVK